MNFAFSLKGNFYQFLLFFLFINKTLGLFNLKTRTAINTKISVFVICVEVIIYLLLSNFHDRTFNFLLLPMLHFLGFRFLRILFLGTYFLRSQFKTLGPCFRLWIDQWSGFVRSEKRSHRNDVNGRCLGVFITTKFTILTLCSQWYLLIPRVSKKSLQK